MLLFYFCKCWFLSFVLCVAVLVVLCIGSVFIWGSRVYVLLTGVHFLQCSEYWVMTITMFVSFICKLFLLIFVCFFSV
jgi:hypothetical protein